MKETKHLDVTLQKADRDGQWILSASTADRVGDTIDAKAYDTALKQAGGELIALWQHKSDQPVGMWRNLKHQAGKLIGDLHLANTNLGLMIKQLLADGVKLSASIGFRGLDAEPNKKGGLHFKAIELLETSIVSVPAHPNAIQIAKEFGIDLRSSEDDAPAVSGDSPSLPDEAIKKAKAAILRANQTLRKRS